MALTCLHISIHTYEYSWRMVIAFLMPREHRIPVDAPYMEAQQRPKASIR